jgi:hypothetical protein
MSKASTTAWLASGGCCCRHALCPEQAASMECQCDAIWKPPTSITAANAASSANAIAPWARSWRQTSQVMSLLQPS